MKERLFSRIAAFSVRDTIIGTFFLTIAIELATIFSRFLLGIESTRDTAFLAGLTLGMRIHHGYWGLPLLVAAWLVNRSPGWRNSLVMVGVALVLSDLIHHFLVLWPITGNAEFDLTYPRDA